MRRMCGAWSLVRGVNRRDDVIGVFHFFVETKSEKSTYVGIRISRNYLSTYIKNKSQRGSPSTASSICNHSSADVQQSVVTATSGQLRSTSHPSTRIANYLDPD